jgi:hypothetical protein
MKKIMFFLLVVVLVAAYSCKRTDAVDPMPKTVDQPNDSLKIQSLTPSVIAGSFNHSGAANGTGSAARFNHPMGIFTKSDGSLLVADFGNLAIRKISTTNAVTTPYHLPYSPTDVAAIFDGAVGVVSDNQITVFSHGTHITQIVKPGKFDFAYAGIDKNPGSTFFWYSGSDIVASSMGSIDEDATSPVRGILISITAYGVDMFPIVSFSIDGNDNKFIISRKGIYECTHGGVIFSLLPGFTYLRSIIASHDGTKLYVSDKGLIKRITRGSGKPTVTTLLATADADGLALSNDERTLYFTSVAHNTVSRVTLP